MPLSSVSDEGGTPPASSAARLASFAASTDPHCGVAASLSTYFLTIATVLGTGVLGLPVSLYRCGVRPFLVWFTVTVVAQCGTVYGTVELLQRAQRDAALRSRETRVIGSNAVGEEMEQGELDGAGVPAVSGKQAQAISQTDLWLDGDIAAAAVSRDNHADLYGSMEAVHITMHHRRGTGSSHSSSSSSSSSGSGGPLRQASPASSVAVASARRPHPTDKHRWEATAAAEDGIVEETGPAPDRASVRLFAFCVHSHILCTGRPASVRPAVPRRRCAPLAPASGPVVGVVGDGCPGSGLGGGALLSVVHHSAAVLSQCGAAGAHRGHRPESHLAGGDRAAGGRDRRTGGPFVAQPLERLGRTLPGGHGGARRHRHGDAGHVRPTGRTTEHHRGAAVSGGGDRRPAHLLRAERGVVRVGVGGGAADGTAVAIRQCHRGAVVGCGAAGGRDLHHPAGADAGTAGHVVGAGGGRAGEFVYHGVDHGVVSGGGRRIAAHDRRGGGDGREEGDEQEDALSSAASRLGDRSVSTVERGGPGDDAEWVAAAAASGPERLDGGRRSGLPFKALRMNGTALAPVVELWHRPSVRRYVLYATFYGFILVMALLNPHGFLAVMAGFTSLGLNLACGVFVALMLLCSAAVAPRPQPDGPPTADAEHDMLPDAATTVPLPLPRAVARAVAYGCLGFFGFAVAADAFWWLPHRLFSGGG
eukprot:ctg_35.g103